MNGSSVKITKEVPIDPYKNTVQNTKEKNTNIQNINRKPGIDKSPQTLVNSKSAETIERVWKPTPQSRLAKPESNTSIQPEETSRKMEEKAYPRQTQTKPTITPKIEESAK